MITEAGGDQHISITLKAQGGAHDKQLPGESDEEAIVDFVKDHKELYDNTNDYFNDKVREDLSLGEICQQSQTIS